MIRSKRSTSLPKPSKFGTGRCSRLALLLSDFKRELLASRGDQHSSELSPVGASLEASQGAEALGGNCLLGRFYARSNPLDRLPYHFLSQVAQVVGGRQQGQLDLRFGQAKKPEALEAKNVFEHTDDRFHCR